MGPVSLYNCPATARPVRHPSAQNYAELYNLTCPITPRLAEQIVGPELVSGGGC